MEPVPGAHVLDPVDGPEARVVSDLDHVPGDPHVPDGDVGYVLGVLVEGVAYLHRVAVRVVDAVVPIAEVARGWVEVRGLHGGVGRHVPHLVAVVLEELLVRVVAVRAVAPRPQHELGE